MSDLIAARASAEIQRAGAFVDEQQPDHRGWDRQSVIEPLITAWLLGFHARVLAKAARTPEAFAAANKSIALYRKLATTN
ncbi:hypothetical protein AB0C29_02850 [Actinoplanes sp. NPDC048791]|uniref:hypothetical protein n=1 Tax=Actinoplanes sp. NPDC048791 TaxID=3154623 RepID=UPI0033E5C542